MSMSRYRRIFERALATRQLYIFAAFAFLLLRKERLPLSLYGYRLKAGKFVWGKGTDTPLVLPMGKIYDYPLVGGKRMNLTGTFDREGVLPEDDYIKVLDTQWRAITVEGMYYGLWYAGNRKVKALVGDKEYLITEEPLYLPGQPFTLTVNNLPIGGVMSTDAELMQLQRNQFGIVEFDIDHSYREKGQKKVTSTLW